jgi:hypothetical protein
MLSQSVKGRWRDATNASQVFRCHRPARPDDPVRRGFWIGSRRRGLLDARRSLSSGGAKRRPVGGHDN